jgi:hypothetical protein
VSGERPEKSKVVAIRPKDYRSSGQISLLPLVVDAEYPAHFGSADLRTIVKSIDGHYYAIKSETDVSGLPASEFLCYRIATACNLAVPFSAVMQLSNSELVFGSRFEGGIVDVSTISPSEELQMFKAGANAISGALAIDLFVGNEDRHKGNFIFRKNHKGEWVPTAIDFSRALFVRGFPGDPFPVSEQCNTRTTIKLLKNSELWRGPFAVHAVTKLFQVERNHVEHWLDEMPLEWLPIRQRTNLLDWWESNARSERIKQVMALL